MKHEFSCLGFICTCEKKPEPGLKLTEEQFDSVCNRSKEIGFQRAVRALFDYKGEDVTSCLHSTDWAIWLDKNMERILK